MEPSTDSPVPEEFPKEEIPAEIREALDEVNAAIEALNRDREAIIMERDFERGIHLRDRGETLKRQKQKIMGEWQRIKAAKQAEPGAETDVR